MRRLRQGPLVWSFVALLGWALLSLLWTANRYDTVRWVVLLAMAGIAFRLAYIVAGEAIGRRRLVWAYLASAVAMSSYGLYLYVADTYDRLTSSFYWPNPAAGYLIPAIIISIDGLRRGGRYRWGWFGLTVLFGTSFELADSRAAAAVLFLILLAYFLVEKLNKRFWIHIVLAIAASFIAIAGMVQLRHVDHPRAVITAPGSRFAEAVAGGSVSGADRVAYLQSAANMWWHAPILGVGAGAYGDVHPQYQQRAVSAANNAHNFYVQTWAEIGMFGAIFLGWLLLTLGLGIARGLFLQTGGPVVLVLGLFGLLIHIGLDIDASYPAVFLLVAALAGLTFGQRAGDVGPLGWRLPVLAALLLAPLLSLYQSDVWTRNGQIEQSNGNYEAAINDFAQAHSGLVYNPDVLTAEGIDWYTAAPVASKLADIRADEAIALDRARSAEQQDPYDGQHHQLEGRIFIQEGKLAEAATAFATALRLDPHNHPDYALDLATTQWGLGDTNAALAMANAMLAQYPASVLANRSADPTVAPAIGDLWALVGSINLKRGQLAAARAAAVKSVAVNPGNLHGRALMVQVLKRHS